LPITLGSQPSGRPEGTGGGASGGALHAEQHFEYHRTVRAGDVLTASQRAGATWEKQSRRGGNLRFTEAITEYRDVATQELVVTARMVAVHVHRPVEGA